MVLWGKLPWGDNGDRRAVAVTRPVPPQPAALRGCGVPGQLGAGTGWLFDRSLCRVSQEQSPCPGGSVRLPHRLRWSLRAEHSEVNASPLVVQYPAPSPAYGCSAPALPERGGTAGRNPSLAPAGAAEQTAAELVQRLVFLKHEPDQPSEPEPSLCNSQKGSGVLMLCNPGTFANYRISKIGE